MKKKVILIFMILLCCSATVVYALPGGMQGTGVAEVDSTLGDVLNILALIAGFVCLAKLIQIGAMYILSGATDKSQAKAAVLPWLIGTIICGGYVVIGNKVIDIISAGNNGDVFGEGDPSGAVNGLGQAILSYVQYFAWAVAVGAVIVVGIKYMMAAAGEKATVKKNLFPIVIGIIIVALATTIMDIVLGWGQSIT